MTTWSRGQDTCTTRASQASNIQAVNGRPEASSPAALRRMVSQRRANTGPELALRRALHAKGLRFRIHREPLPGLRRSADIVFPSERVAVFVQGCFWHGCPHHATWPKANAEWWRQKIDGNRQRDKDTDHRLADAGWVAVRVWEHESIDAAANNILWLVRDRQKRSRGGLSAGNNPVGYGSKANPTKWSPLEGGNCRCS
jgi:DNA mismatch endonuclease (patch repair protein)